MPCYWRRQVSIALACRAKSVRSSDCFASAPGQGALAIQCRTADLGQDWMKRVHHQETFLRIQAERGALEALEASCRTAVGAYATVDDGKLSLFVEALSSDGRKRWQRREAISTVTPDTARELGLRLGLEIKAEAGPDLILV